jgi:hypothetical protein
MVNCQGSIHVYLDVVESRFKPIHMKVVGRPHGVPNRVWVLDADLVRGEAEFHKVRVVVCPNDQWGGTRTLMVIGGGVHSKAGLDYPSPAIGDLAMPLIVRVPQDELVIFAGRNIDGEDAPGYV